MKQWHQAEIVLIIVAIVLGWFLDRRARPWPIQSLIASTLAANVVFIGAVAVNAGGVRVSIEKVVEAVIPG